tara:strand:+ start:2817 stop:3110 length:294 start_codon:yes stop_codon:yes gene_type:complete
MFERDEESDRINNVTWKGVLEYLPRFVGEELIQVINKQNLNETDTKTLLGISPEHIHLARKTYLLEHNTVWGTTDKYAKKKWSNNYTDSRESSLTWS